jgi:ADP-dependent NAD(P)H-hydrate dehydratase
MIFFMAPELITTPVPLPPRSADAHKGTFGHVLVVAGSRGMSGAAVLCGTATLRGGTGTVTIATPEEIQPNVAVGQPCATTAGLPQTESGTVAAHALPLVLHHAKRATALAVGPGLGNGPAVAAFVLRLLQASDLPIVLDADGLSVLKSHPSAADRSAPTILTPHPGEFARLIGIQTADVQANRQTLAVETARSSKTIIVLKGAGTLVTDGRRLYVNRTGNPGMATGGSGDVLTGLIAALLAQRLEPFAAAQLGVHLHGLAGDLARDDLGEDGLIATDLLDYLPKAIVRYRSAIPNE